MRVLLPTLDVSNESSARQRIQMKNQALFSSKDKSKKLECCLLQFLFGALRVRTASEYLMLLHKKQCHTLLTAVH